MPVTTELKRDGQRRPIHWSWTILDLLGDWMAEERNQHLGQDANGKVLPWSDYLDEGEPVPTCATCGQTRENGPHDTAAFPRSGSYTFTASHSAELPFSNFFSWASESDHHTFTFDVQAGDVYGAWR